MAHCDEDAAGLEKVVLAFVEHRPADHVHVDLLGVVEVAGVASVKCDCLRMCNGCVSRHHVDRYETWRRGSAINGVGTMNSSCVSVESGCVKIGRSSGASAACSSRPPSSPRSSTSADSSRSRELGEPLDVVDVPGNGVPLLTPALEEPAERHGLPPVDLEVGLHRLDAQVADADERRDATQLGRDAVRHPTGHAEDVVVPVVERLDVVADMDDVKVPADGEHTGSLASEKD